MSDLKKFLEKANQDEAIQTQLKEAQNYSDIVKIGKENNYNFTEDDIKQLKEEQTKSGALSEEDLNKVSGGTLIISLASCRIC